MTAAAVLAGRFWQFVDEGKWDEARSLLPGSFRADWPQTEEEVLGANRYIEVARDGKLVEAIEYFPAPKEPKYETH